MPIRLKPIISDPEYLLDQHILISIKSSDSDESYGEGCIALRLEATEMQVPIYTPLTHHGEMTGHFQGEIKLQTSQGKKREKLYDFVKTERDEASGMKCLKSLTSHDPVRQWEPAGRVPACGAPGLTEIINPNYMANRGLCPRTQETRPGDLGKNPTEALLQEDLQPTKPEMFENPLYGSVSSFPKPVPRKEQESPKMLRKEPPPCPDLGISPNILLPKAQEAEGGKGTGKQAPVPVFGPTPRVRSFTCSSQAEGRTSSGDKSQGKPKASTSSQAPVPVKRPIKPSRSEMSQPTTPTPAPRPPLPVKSPAVLQLQHSKGRDYRDNTELPHHSKHRPEEGLLSRTAMQ